MKMQVIDQLHVSSVGPSTMGKGTEFEVTDAIGMNLEKRGLARKIADSETEPKATAAPSEKAESAPANKAEPAAPSNKSEPKPKTKGGKS